MAHRAASAAQRNRRPVFESFEQALACHQHGRLADAEQHYQAVLEADDRHFGAVHGLGLVRLQQGRFADAVLLFRRAIKIDRHSAEAHHHLAVALTGLGRPEDAIERFEKALAIRPDFAEAHDSLGHALQLLCRYEAAIARHEKALTIKPSYAEALNNLGNALHKSGRSDKAIPQYEKALAIRPNYPEAHNNLAQTLAALQRYQEAIGHYESALAMRPEYVGVRINLANALGAISRREEAVAHYKKVISHYENVLAITPNNAEAHISLGAVLGALDRHEEAVAHYEKALTISPRNVEAHNSLSNLLLILGRPEQAIAHCQKALAINPNDVKAHSSLGTALRDTGKVDQAIHAFEQAIALAPRKAGIYWNLARSRRFTSADPHLVAMNKLAEEMASLDTEDQIGLHFALGKVFADLGDHERSARRLLQANSLKRRLITYDEAKMLERFRQIRTVFTTELMHNKQGLGEPSSVPVFIVGMPRSGTTLVEQILASHPKVFGAGELRELGRLVGNISDPNGSNFPEGVRAMSGERLRELGASYLRAIRSIAPTFERVTDKMPGNFAHAGLIHLALPHARIIHTRREPRDTALSCFSLLFANGQEYTYDLAELGRYYRAYRELMEHWCRVLPEGVMLEVQYEDLVGNLEYHARRILAHCGLEWDDACLAFHETKRSVQTASATQVRQPIYHTSVERWRPYEDLLQPFLQALEGSQAAEAMGSLESTKIPP